LEDESRGSTSGNESLSQLTAPVESFSRIISGTSWTEPEPDPDPDPDRRTTLFPITKETPIPLLELIELFVNVEFVAVFEFVAVLFEIPIAIPFPFPTHCNKSIAVTPPWWKTSSNTQRRPSITKHTNKNRGKPRGRKRKTGDHTTTPRPTVVTTSHATTPNAHTTGRRKLKLEIGNTRIGRKNQLAEEKINSKEDAMRFDSSRVESSRAVGSPPVDRKDGVDAKVSYENKITKQRGTHEMEKQTRKKRERRGEQMEGDESEGRHKSSRFVSTLLSCCPPVLQSSSPPVLLVFFSILAHPSRLTEAHLTATVPHHKPTLPTDD